MKKTLVQEIKAKAKIMVAKRERRRRKDIAFQRIERLFELAEEAAKEARMREGREREEMERRSDRYVLLARKISMRHRVRIPRHLKMWICKRCNAFLIPGRNARVRLRRGEYITITCLRCGAEKRRPYKAPRPPSPRRQQSTERAGKAEKRRKEFNVL
ncbi:MAG: Ribonuclease P protein subunit RPR2 [Methanophagales archaeon]|nr:Ribonuclease P protein subunit RPR2 [Methanophagales archaeon]